MRQSLKLGVILVGAIALGGCALWDGVKRVVKGMGDAGQSVVELPVILYKEGRGAVEWSNDKMEMGVENTKNFMTGDPPVHKKPISLPPKEGASLSIHEDLRLAMLANGLGCEPGQMLVSLSN